MAKYWRRSFTPVTFRQKTASYKVLFYIGFFLYTIREPLGSPMVNGRVCAANSFWFSVFFYLICSESCAYCCLCSSIALLIAHEIKIAVYHIHLYMIHLYMKFEVNSQYQANSVSPSQLYLTLNMIKSCFWFWLLFFFFWLLSG